MIWNIEMEMEIYIDFKISKQLKQRKKDFSIQQVNLFCNETLLEEIQQRRMWNVRKEYLLCWIWIISFEKSGIIDSVQIIFQFFISFFEVWWMFWFFQNQNNFFSINSPKDPSFQRAGHTLVVYNIIMVNDSFDGW